MLPSRKRAVLHQYRRGTLKKRLRSTEVMRNSDMRLARLIVRGTPTPSSPKAQTRRKKLATPQLPGLLRRAPIWPASTPACLAGPRVAKAYDDDLVLGFGLIEPRQGRAGPLGRPCRVTSSRMGVSRSMGTSCKRQGPAARGGVLELERGDAQQLAARADQGRAAPPGRNARALVPTHASVTAQWINPGK